MTARRASCSSPASTPCSHGGTAVVAAVDRRAVGPLHPGRARRRRRWSPRRCARRRGALRRHRPPRCPRARPVDSAALSEDGAQARPRLERRDGGRGGGRGAGDGRAVDVEAEQRLDLRAGRSRAPRGAGRARLGRRRGRRGLRRRARLHAPGGGAADGARADPPLAVASSWSSSTRRARARPSITSAPSSGWPRAIPGAHARRLRAIRARPPTPSCAAYETRDAPRRCCARSRAAHAGARARSGATPTCRSSRRRSRARPRWPRELGGAAKPSGAGGGDVGVAFFSDPEAAQRFRDARRRHDLPDS